MSDNIQQNYKLNLINCKNYQGEHGVNLDYKNIQIIIGEGWMAEILLEIEHQPHPRYTSSYITITHMLPYELMRSTVSDQCQVNRRYNS